MSKRVLLTGASGFIGARVLHYMLRETDWEFTCLASWRHRGNPRRITDVTSYGENQNRVSFFTHDLRGSIPDYGHFDYILNLASESHVDRSISDPVPFIENNVMSTVMMLEYARKENPEVFLQFSTDEVYGADEQGQVGEEWGTILPSNPYAASKAAQEAIAIAYWRTYAVPVVITNTNNVIGPGQDAEKFVPRILNAVTHGKRLSVHVHNGEMGSRFYNPVDNVADALLFILRQAVATQGRPDRYNLSGGVELTNLGLAQKIADLLKMKLLYDKVEVEGVRPGYDCHYAAADGKLHKMGWVPPVTFEEGLKETVEEYLQQRLLRGTR